MFIDCLPSSDLVLWPNNKSLLWYSPAKIHCVSSTEPFTEEVLKTGSEQSINEQKMNMKTSETIRQKQRVQGSSEKSRVWGREARGALIKEGLLNCLPKACSLDEMIRWQPQMKQTYTHIVSEYPSRVLQWRDPARRTVRIYLPTSKSSPSPDWVLLSRDHALRIPVTLSA